MLHSDFDNSLSLVAFLKLVKELLLVLWFAVETFPLESTKDDQKSRFCLSEQCLKLYHRLATFYPGKKKTSCLAIRFQILFWYSKSSPKAIRPSHPKPLPADSTPFCCFVAISGRIFAHASVSVNPCGLRLTVQFFSNFCHRRAILCLKKTNLLRT